MRVVEEQSVVIEMERVRAQISGKMSYTSRLVYVLRILLQLEHFCAFDGIRAFLHFVCASLFLCILPKVERRRVPLLKSLEADNVRCVGVFLARC